MLKFSAIIAVLGLISVASARNALPGEYPAHVALHITNNRFGEGVILNQNHVLTVAQNVFDPVTNHRLGPADITVRPGVVLIGQNPGAAMGVIRIFAHSHYNFHTLKFNVAVLRTLNDFVFQPDVPIPTIDTVRFHNRIVWNTKQCNLVGWNVPPNHQTSTLQVISAPVADRNVCNVIDNVLVRGHVRDQHICVGPMTQNPPMCNGNDGAAFYCDGALVALRVLGRQCNMALSPAIMIQTRWFQEWIPQQFTRNDNPQAGPVPPPGITDSASSVILSSVVLMAAALVKLITA